MKRPQPLAKSLRHHQRPDTETVFCGGVLHHPPKAKRIIQLFMAGAASHIDLWDHKPQLEKHHGESSDFGEHVEAFQDGLGPWMKSPFQFSRYGQCGKAHQ